MGRRSGDRGQLRLSPDLRGGCPGAAFLCDDGRGAACSRTRSHGDFAAAGRLGGHDRSAHRTRKPARAELPDVFRSEEHTSELQSLMRISYAVFCLKKKKQKYEITGMMH